MEEKTFQVHDQQALPKRFDVKACQDIGSSQSLRFNSGARLLYAGFWKRFAAAFIDGLITAVLGMIAGGIWGFMYGASTGRIDAAVFLGQAASIFVGWVYFASFESSSRQATPGKMALGIIVTDYYGRKIGFGKATGRHFGKIVSALLLLAGFIMIAFTEKKQGLHDMMSGCVVVNK